MKRATKFLKILLTVPLALVVAGYATVVAQDLREDDYKPVPRGFKPESTHCPCWNPKRVRGISTAPDLLNKAVLFFLEINRLGYLGYEVNLLDAWEDFLDGSCLRVGVMGSPKKKLYACDVAWGSWNGDSCDIEEEDLFEASYDDPLLNRSCEIAINETIDYVSSVAE